MELNNFLNNGGNRLINVISIYWIEYANSNKPQAKLHKIVRNFYPQIRSIKANVYILRDLGPLSRVPTIFLFNKKGERVYGLSKQNFFDIEKLKIILVSTK